MLCPRLKMADDRKLEVLRVIVEDYVRTSEPVGSKALVDRHHLGVSPATIRNDMSVLEEEGYIVQPHTSAGRIPTDKGYRLFVDQLSRMRQLSPVERNAINAFLDGAVDLDDVMLRSVRLLAQLTRQMAVVQYPSLAHSRVRHIELVEVGSGRLLLVVIADSGRIEQRILVGQPTVDEQTLSRIQAALRAATVGIRFADVAENVAGLPEDLDRATGGAGAVAGAVVGALLEMVLERHEERVLVGGAANLARSRDFSARLEPVLDALEEQLVLLRLLGAQATDADAITVTIGHENDVEGLTATSAVTAGYGTIGEPVGRLGVVGPTRMDYPANMAVVRAVARYLGRLLYP